MTTINMLMSERYGLFVKIQKNSATKNVTL